MKYRFLILILSTMFFVSCQKEYSIDGVVPFPPSDTTSTTPPTDETLTPDNGGLLKKLVYIDNTTTDSVQMNFSFDAANRLISITRHLVKIKNPKNEDYTLKLAATRSASGAIIKVTMVERVAVEDVPVPVVHNSEAIIEYNETTKQYVSSVLKGQNQFFTNTDSSSFIYDNNSKIFTQQVVKSRHDFWDDSDYRLKFTYDNNDNIKAISNYTIRGGTETLTETATYGYDDKSNFLQSDVFNFFLTMPLFSPGRNNVTSTTFASEPDYQVKYAYTYNPSNKPRKLVLTDDENETVTEVYFYYSK